MGSSDRLGTILPELSRSASPRRPTCRAPCLYGSVTEPMDTMEQDGRNRPAWMRLFPRFVAMAAAAVVIQRLIAVASHCSASVCLYAGVEFFDGSTPRNEVVQRCVRHRSDLLGCTMRDSSERGSKRLSAEAVP
jgi:hypothetical protein